MIVGDLISPNIIEGASSDALLFFGVETVWHGFVTRDGENLWQMLPAGSRKVPFTSITHHSGRDTYER